MSAVTELETLRIRLQGDSSSYLNSLKAAEAGTAKATASVEKQLASVEKTTTATMNATSTATVNALGKTGSAAQAGFEKFQKFSSGVSSAVGAFSAIAGAAAAVAGLGVAVYNLHPAVVALRKELERTAEIAKEMDRIQRRSFGRQMERIDAPRGTMEKIQVGEQELKRARGEASTYEADVRRLKKSIAELEPTWRSAWQSERQLWNLEKANLEEVKKKLGGTKEQIEAIENKLRQLRAAADAELEGIKESLKEKIDTTGMTNSEREMWKLRRQGFDQKKVGEIGELFKIADLREATNEIDDLTKSLDEQMKTIGMTANEVLLYKAQLKGVNPLTIEWARAMDRHNTALQLGKQWMDEYATSEEKLAKGMAELDRVYKAGAISLDVYERRAEDLTKQFRAMKAALDPIQGAAEGSSEALSRMIAYRDSMDTRRNREVGFFGRPPLPEGRPGAPPERNPVDNPINPQQQQDARENTELLRQIRDAVQNIDRKSGRGPNDIRIGNGF